MKQNKLNFGRYYEKFTVGDVIIHSQTKTISESDNNLFCLLTMNHHPVHLNKEYAKQTQHGKILVVGTYVFSLVVGLSVRDISGKAIANLDYEKITHDRPVFIGDTIYAETEILDKRESKSRPTQGIVSVRTRGHKSDGTLFMTFDRSMLVAKRGHGIEN